MTVEAARQSCSFLLARLEAEVARLRELAFPGHHTGPRKWLSFISGILDTGYAYLRIASDPATSPDQASILVKNAEAVGDEAYKLLRYVAGADATQIPHQVVAPFQRWVDRLAIPNTIFFRAEHLPNYELWTFDASSYVNLNHATQTLSDSINAIRWPVLRVTVPGQAMGMLPHFAVVAHELGHAIQDRLKPDFAKHAVRASQSLAHIEARLKTDNIPYDQSELVVRASEILTSWINEIKADSIGHALVGPAFFLALCGFLELAGQGYGVGPTHPPSDFRRKFLFDQLSTGSPSFAEVFVRNTGKVLGETTNSPHLRLCPATDQLYLELTKSLGPVVAAICVELVPYIRAVAPDILAATLADLRAKSPELIYTPEQLETDLKAHLDLLCALVPPIEYRDTNGVHPTALASILNVGWTALLTRIDQIPDTVGHFGDDTAQKMERLHELLLKAVELSEARRLWEEYP